MWKILIIEDDRALAEGLCRVLTVQEAGRIQAEGAGTLREAGKRLSEEQFDLVILDINLPDGNGFDFLAEVREKKGIPVIMLTANDLESDIVAGLEAGAEDYITKPFRLAELRARVHAQLRRVEREKTVREETARTGTVRNGTGVYCCDGFRFDFDRMHFTAKGREVELSRTEQKLLRILTEHAEGKVGRAELIDWIWTDGAEYVDENALSVAVKRLRDKLGAQEYIRTVYGIGYMWTERGK